MCTNSSSILGDPASPTEALALQWQGRPRTLSAELSGDCMMSLFDDEIQECIDCFCISQKSAES